MRAKLLRWVSQFLQSKLGVLKRRMEQLKVKLWCVIGNPLYCSEIEGLELDLVLYLLPPSYY